MELRWLGEVELTFIPSFLPFPCPYIHGKKTPSHFPQWLGNGKTVSTLPLSVPSRMGSVETL